MLTAPFPLLPVLFLTALFFLNFTARVILAPLLPVVKTELAIGHGTAGALFLFIQIGYAAGLLASGFLSAALTPRRTIVAWRNDRFEWSEPSYPGVNVENDPDYELYVTTVKNGRY